MEAGPHSIPKAHDILTKILKRVVEKGRAEIAPLGPKIDFLVACTWLLSDKTGSLLWGEEGEEGEQVKRWSEDDGRLAQHAYHRPMPQSSTQ